MSAEDPLEAAQEVQILMAVRNGLPYLDAQVQSIFRQDHPRWRLTISDDGSRDGSLERAADLQASHKGRIRAVEGPRRGYGANFRELILTAPLSPQFFCLSDQDDVWHKSRLSRAIAMLRNAGEVPSIAIAAREISDSRLGGLRPDTLPRDRLSFRNALFESVLPGNAMMMNRAAFLLIRRAMAVSENISSHDWLIYQIATGAGIRIIFDDEPTVIYRQHAANQVGSISGVSRTLNRIRAFSFRRYRTLLDRSWDNLLRNRHLLHDENRRLLDDAVGLGRMSLPKRWRTFRRNGYFRTGRADRIVLGLTVLTGLPSPGTRAG